MYHLIIKLGLSTAGMFILLIPVFNLISPVTTDVTMLALLSTALILGIFLTLIFLLGDEVREYQKDKDTVKKMLDSHMKLILFKDSFVKKFEQDFVVDGEIVNDPEEKYHPLLEWYESAKEMI